MEKGKKVIQIGVKLEESVYQELVYASDMVGIPPSSFVRELIRRRALPFASDFLLEKKAGIEKRLHDVKDKLDAAE